MNETSERKIIARRRIRGLIIFLIVVFSLVLIWDLCDWVGIF